MTHIIFDLDNTLIRTVRLNPYMKTCAGREYVTQNIRHLPTEICHPCLEEMLQACNLYGDRVSIVTNSPADYARAVLDKHRILNGVPIFANAHKPFPDGIEQAVDASGIPKEETVMIGDAAIDILAAHGAEIASIATAWGYNTVEQLNRAEPTATINDPEELQGAIEFFEKGEMEYTPREELDRYHFLPEAEFDTHDPEFNHSFLDIYYPWSDEAFNNFSNNVLRFKSAKDVSIEAINRGVSDQYFAGGRVRQGSVFRDVLWGFIHQLRGVLSNLQLDGKTLIIAAPNSFPEYCYKTDISHLFVKNLIKEQRSFEMSKRRVISRVHPKSEAHLAGIRSAEEHYRTMGYTKTEFDDYNNVVLFDDVTTSGTQLTCMAKMIRHFGFRGNFYCVTLGRTR